MKHFVIVVDMQGDFVAPDGALPVAGAEELIMPMNAWLAALKPEAVEGVLFTQDTHTSKIYATSKEAELFPLHCVRGTAGWNLAVDPAALDPSIPYYRLEKGVFDMWAEPTGSIERIDQQARIDRDAFFANLREAGVKEVTVVGVAADYCVRWAVDGLLERGFQIRILSKLTRGIVRQIDAVAADEWVDARVAIS